MLYFKDSLKQKNIFAISVTDSLKQNKYLTVFIVEGLEQKTCLPTSVSV